MIKKIKENFKIWRKLKDIKNRKEHVWTTLKKYHKESGNNYGTYEKEKYIEICFSLDNNNKVVKKYIHHIDEQNDSLKSIVYISEGFDSDKAKDILILASHFNSLMNKGHVIVNTDKETISMEYRIPLLIPYLYELEIHNQCQDHYNHSRDIVWAFNRLLIFDEDPIFIMVDLMKKIKERVK